MQVNEVETPQFDALGQTEMDAKIPDVSGEADFRPRITTKVTKAHAFPRSSPRRGHHRRNRHFGSALDLYSGNLKCNPFIPPAGSIIGLFGTRPTPRKCNILIRGALLPATSPGMSPPAWVRRNGAGGGPLPAPPRRRPVLPGGAPRDLPPAQLPPGGSPAPGSVPRRRSAARHGSHPRVRRPARSWPRRGSASPGPAAPPARCPGAAAGRPRGSAPAARSSSRTPRAAPQ